jgi:mannose-6-phosphate isomerase-like protein (cupin superfamily)
MKIHANESDVAPGGPLIGKDNGATSGFCLGISYYASTDYGTPGIHDDQEGFYILEGRGMARVGNEEFVVEPGTAFIANKGVPHTLKRDASSGPIKVLWCHGAV